MSPITEENLEIAKAIYAGSGGIPKALEGMGAYLRRTLDYDISNDEVKEVLDAMVAQHSMEIGKSEVTGRDVYKPVKPPVLD